MSTNTLSLENRTASGKQVAKLRAEGFVPSVVYGGQSDPVATQSPTVETTKVVKAAGKHSPIDIVVDGNKTLAILKTIDIDPVRHTIRHLAFHTIKQNEVITTQVPITLTGIGESDAEKAGLVILQAIESVEIKAKPADLPKTLELSIASLKTDEDKLTLSDITLPKGVEYDDLEQDMTLVVANVYEPGALQAANDAAGGDAEDATDVAADNGEAVEAPQPEQK